MRTGLVLPSRIGNWATTLSVATSMTVTFPPASADTLAQGDVHRPPVRAQRHPARTLAYRDRGDDGVGARRDDGDSIGDFIADVEQRPPRARAERAEQDEGHGEGGGAPPASRLGQWNVRVSR